MAIQRVNDHRGTSPPANIHLRTELSEFLDGLGETSRGAGPTAGALLSFDGYRLRRPFHAVVERGHNFQRVGHYVHTTQQLPLIDCETVDGIRVTSPTRTLIDLAASATPQQLTAALDGALRDRLTTETFLHQRIVALRGRGRYGIPMLLQVIEGVEVTRGAHSWLEREFLRLVHAAGMPLPAAQQVLGRRNGKLIRVDFRFPETRLVVEVLGYRYHRTTMQMGVDAERVNALTMSGFLVMQFTYEQVVQRPEWVAGQVAKALLLGRAA
jgi:hypothetical protein